MPFDDLHRIVPLPPRPEVAEILVAHQLTYEFRWEVNRRQEFDQYCQWYYAAADRHRKELAKMQRDINILGWFCRR